MDVTHISCFGKLSYVHMTIDTFSQFTWATAHSSETTMRLKNIYKDIYMLLLLLQNYQKR